MDEDAARRLAEVPMGDVEDDHHHDTTGGAAAGRNAYHDGDDDGVVSDIADDDDGREDEDDAAVEGAFASTNRPSQAARSGRPMTAASSRARSVADTGAQHTAAHAAAQRVRQRGRLAADDIEGLAAMLRDAVRRTGHGGGLVNMIQHGQRSSHGVRSASASRRTADPEDAFVPAAASGAGAAAVRASRPQTAKSRPPSAAAAPRPPSGAAARESASRAASAKGPRRPLTAATTRSAGAATAATSTGAMSAADALEERYCGGISAAKKLSLVRDKVVAQRVYERHGFEVPEHVLDETAASVGPAHLTADDVPEGTAAGDAAGVHLWSRAGASTAQSGLGGRPPSGARSRPTTAGTTRRSRPGSARPVSASSTTRRGVATSWAPASSGAGLDGEPAAPVDLDPKATLGTAQVLALRHDEEGRVLTHSHHAGTTRPPVFFDAFEYDGIDSYLKTMKLRRHAPFRLAAEREKTTRGAASDARAAIAGSSGSAVEYIQKYVHSLGPLCLER